MTQQYFTRRSTLMDILLLVDASLPPKDMVSDSSSSRAEQEQQWHLEHAGAGVKLLHGSLTAAFSMLCLYRMLWRVSLD
jgi:hypothetical protein